MPTADDLAAALLRMDGRGYRAYKDLSGSYAFPALDLYVDHVQGDPFAAPSKVRVRVPMREAALPRTLFESRTRRIALADCLARRTRRAIDAGSAQGERARSGGSGKSGLVAIDAGGQEVLERTAVVIDSSWVEARLEVGLPANGRRIAGPSAARLLLERLPRIARDGLCWARIEADDEDEDTWRFVECVENQEHIRGQLEGLGLVAFVGDGAVLPRESGASDRPLARARAVPFRAPPELAVRIRVPNAPSDDNADASDDGEQGGEVVGLGIPRGVTLIAGGGYHGKSTLLRALERGVYPHVPGDGRELVVTDPRAVKIRAEDGRRVERVDIHPFIDALPRDGQGDAASTRAFSSDDASGSTSQAANIVEAVEAGATALLLDEDTSATNFMVRDARMQALVHKEHEPITPFVDRVRELYDTFGVSTVLVMGGCGDYFDVADHAIVMREYAPHEATEEARAIARAHPSGRRVEAARPMEQIAPRVPVASSFDPRRGRRDVKIDAVERDRIRYGEETLDLRGLDQLVDWSQTRAVGFAVHLAAQRFMHGGATLPEVLDALDALLDEAGLDVLDPFQRLAEGPDEARSRPRLHPGRFARPRRFEVAAALNRLRSLHVAPPGGGVAEER